LDVAWNEPSLGRAIALRLLPAPPLNHAGGIQRSGEIVAVGVEDSDSKRRSQVQFWNFADPRAPFQLGHLAIDRGAKNGPTLRYTAGAVGFCQHASHHWLVVGDWDSVALDFFRSSGPLETPTTRMESYGHWLLDSADRRSWQPNRTWRAYQALQLIPADDLLPPGSSGLLLLGLVDRHVDVYEVQWGKKIGLRKLADWRLPLEQASFLWSGGAERRPNGQWFFYATEKHGTEHTRIEIVRADLDAPIRAAALAPE